MSDPTPPQVSGSSRPPRYRCHLPVPSPRAGESWIRKGSEPSAPFYRKRSPAAQPPAAGRAPAGRMGWGSHKEPRGGERGLGPPPASVSAAAGSGCDKLNLRALEKLQEEESEECAEWLKGALSPRELRPPRPAPPSPERAQRPGEGVARLQLREHLRPKRERRPPPQPQPPPAHLPAPPAARMTTSTPAAPPQEPGRGRARWGRGRRKGAGSKRHGQRHARPERQDRGAAAIALSSWLPAPGPGPLLR